MDLRRRRTLAALALLPLTPALAGRGRAASAPGSTVPLLVSDGAPAPAPPLRYGEGPAPVVLRVARGAPVRIALDNRLARPTSLDLHGLRVPAPLGGPGPVGGAVAAGASAEIGVAPPDAGTFWFHPWILDPGRDEVSAGLAGVLVVDEAAPPEVDADLVLLLSERAPADGGGDGGLLVDRAPGPRRETGRPGARVRLRVVNGATRRAVTVFCEGAVPRVVAIDGQPSALFRPRGGTVPLGPGARCDLMFDLGPIASETRILAGPADARVPVLVLRAEGEPVPARGPIAALAPNPALPEAIALDRATRAGLTATARTAGPAAWAINGVSGLMLPKAPLFRAKRGAPVVLALTNAATELVGFRIHGFCFRRLHDLDDGWEPYWQDSVLVAPGATHHVAFLADLPGRWLIESPFFAQAAGGLRSWFEVS